MVAIRLREVLGQWMVDDGRHPRTGIWHLWHLWPSCRARLPSFQSVASSSYESYMWSYVFYHQFDHHHQVHQVFFLTWLRCQMFIQKLHEISMRFPWDFSVPSEVKEPSQCVYEATMTHPAACDPKGLDGSGEDRILGPHEAHLELWTWHCLGDQTTFFVNISRKMYERYVWKERCRISQDVGDVHIVQRNDDSLDGYTLQRPWFVLKWRIPL